MDDTLRRLQLVQYEILCLIDRVCRKSKICYSLYAGTLLGAVRHQGFIPWDDDLDICMERSEYERFLAAWAKESPPGYLLQNKENTPAFSQSFTKIRKLHTTFLSEAREKGAYHTGIFVDVFPIDRMPENRLGAALFRWDCMCYQLYTREIVPPKGSLPQRLVSATLLAAVRGPRRIRARKRCLSRITARRDRSLPAVAIETVSTINKPLRSSILDEFVRLPFEGGSFMCFAGWDDYLRTKYGDYMTLPPENERTWRHRPLILDFDRDYDEIMKGTSDG